MASHQQMLVKAGLAEHSHRPYGTPSSCLPLGGSRRLAASSRLDCTEGRAAAAEGVYGCVLVCGRARVCEGVRGCVRTCEGVRGCVRVCAGVRVCEDV